MEGGDDILARAKLLSQAANQMASELSNQANEYKAVVDARHKDQAETAAENQHQKKMADKQRQPKGKDIGNQKEFRGAVINGSSLITTYADMRAFVPRGSTLTIDGITCRLQQNNSAEWTANRMELLEDFPGPTNLDACLVTTVTAELVRRRSPRKNKAAPVKSSDILGAVSHLDSGSLLSGRGPLPNPRDYMTQNQSKSQHQIGSSGMSSAMSLGGNKKGKSSSNYRRSSSGKGSGAGDSSLNTGRSEYDTLGSISSFQSSRSASQKHHSRRLGERGGSNGGGSSSPSRSVMSVTSASSSASQAVSTVPPRSECTHLEEEQYQMMLEIDSLTEEEREQARVEMNLRMADRGQRKAHERVEEYKHRLNLPATLMEDQSYSTSAVGGGGSFSPNSASLQAPYSQAGSGFGGASSLLAGAGLEDSSRVSGGRGRGEPLSKDQLAERRREARERYLQKQREEDALVEANFRAERELQEAIKKKMDEKAKKLQEITAQRVAKYKATKRENARKEKEAKELAIALKKEKDKEATSDEYIRKMHARMVETEKRLNRQKKEQEEMAHVQKLLQEVQLRELAAARQRTENTQEYVHVGSKATPSPKKKKKLPGHKNDKDKSVKLPRLNFSGKNSKHVSNFNSARGNRQKPDDTETSEESENDNVVVTVGVQDHYHRKNNLNSPRNSKSEQSSRQAHAHEAKTRRNRRLQKQSSEGGEGGHPQVTHMVHIGKPKQQQYQQQPHQQQLPLSNRNGNEHVTHANAQSRFDAFDNNDDDDFFDNDDDGNLSDDSLTMGRENPPSKAAPHPPQGRSRIPVPVHRAGGAGEGGRDFDAATCVSALTADDDYESQQNFSQHKPAAPPVKKKKKNQTPVWKMQPIDMRAYVPLPEATKGVENR